MVKEIESIEIDGKIYIISTVYLEKYNIKSSNFARDIDKYGMSILRMGKKTTLIEDVEPFKIKKPKKV